MKIKRKSAASGTGGITVFMVLAVLTVAVFAVLTMSSALADQRLSEKNAAQLQAYYEAESKAVRMVNAIEQAWLSGADMESAVLAIDSGAFFWLGWDEPGTAGLSVPAAGDRSFEVELSLLDTPGPDGRSVVITTWAMMSADFGEVISPVEIFN